MNILIEILILSIIAQTFCIGTAKRSEEEPAVKVKYSPMLHNLKSFDDKENKVKLFDNNEYDTSSFNNDMANYYMSSDFFKNTMNTKYLTETFNSLLKEKDQKQINSIENNSNSTHPVELLRTMIEGFMLVANNSTENKTSTSVSLPNPFTVTMEPIVVTSSKTVKPNNSRPVHQPAVVTTEQSTIRTEKNNSFVEEISNKQPNLDIYKPVFVALAEHCDQMRMNIEELKLQQQNLKRENQDLYNKLETLQTSFMESLKSQNEITGKKLDSIKNQQNDEKNYILKVAASLINIEDRLLKENELSLKEIELENILTKTELLQQKMNNTTTEHSQVNNSTKSHPNNKEYENILHNLILEQDFKAVSPKMPTTHHGFTMFTKVSEAVTHKPTEVFKSDIAKMISQIVRIHKNGSQEKVTEEGLDKATEQYDLTFLK